MAVTNEPTLNRKHDLELSLELLSFAGGENTISEDHVCKADEARVVENWDSVSLGGMERSKGFNKVADADVSDLDSYTTLLLHADGTDDSETITDSSTRANTVTNVGNAKIKTAVKKFGTGSLLLNGTTQYATVPSDQKLTNGSFETWTAGDSVAPDGWTFSGAGAAVAKESTTIKVGTYSAKLTRSSGTAALYQEFTTAGGHDASYWRGRSVTFGCWVYATGASQARLYIQADSNYYFSSYHTGVAGWEYLTVTQVLPTLTNVYVACQMPAGSDAYFDGAFVTDDASANFTFGSSDFTIDTWAYFTDVTTAGQRCIASNWLGTGSQRGWDLEWNQSTSRLTFNYTLDGSTTVYGPFVSWTPTINTWYHIEVDRSGSNLYYFINGTQQGTTQSISGYIHPSSEVFSLGALNVSGTPSFFFKGYLDEFRVSKGIARHTASFTAPTSPYRVAYAGSYDLLAQHDDIGGTETYAVMEGNLLKKSSTRMDLEDSGAFTSGILCHAVSVKDNGLYITNATDGLKLKTVGNAISVPADVPPSACARIYNHKNRLLAEGSATYPNRVYGSRVGKGNWDEADAWTLSNDAWSIDLPEDTMGLVPDFPSGDYVLAFTDKNAYALGNFPNTSFRAIGTPARGCSAPYSIAKGDEGVYFASVYPTKGIFLFDGTSFQELTELNHDVFTDKIDFTKRIFGIYRNRRYHIWYNETGSGVTYPNAYRIYDARFKRWMERPINSAVADNFGYPALLNYASWELYNASSRTNYVYELETEDNSDEGENTEAVYTTKSFSSRDFAVAAGGQFPIDDCRMKLLKLTITFYGEVGAVGFYWSADRGLHSGSKTIDLNQTGDMLNTTFILNSSSINATPQEKTRSYTFPNDAVGKRFYFQITNSGTSTRPKIKKIKVSALAFPEP